MIPIGVVVPPDLPPADFVPFVLEAEQFGFDQLWVVEDCFFRGGIAQAAIALAASARITVGIGILPAGARNPAFAALEISTLANVFPGRLVVGVGHGMPGWMRQVGAWPARPVTLLTEYISTLKALLAGRDVSLTGHYVNLDNVALETPPPHVPPVLAGVRGPVSLRRCARVSDGTILAEPVTPEYLAVVRGLVSAAETETEAETDGRPRIVGYNIAAIDDSAARACDLARQGLRWIGDPEWAPHIEPLPFADEFASMRRQAGSREEFAAALPDAWVEKLAIAGTAHSAAARIKELAAAGLSDLVLIPAGPAPRQALGALARILPELRQG